MAAGADVFCKSDKPFRIASPYVTAHSHASVALVAPAVALATGVVAGAAVVLLATAVAVVVSARRVNSFYAQRADQNHPMRVNGSRVAVRSFLSHRTRRQRAHIKGTHAACLACGKGGTIKEVI